MAAVGARGHPAAPGPRGAGGVGPPERGAGGSRQAVRRAVGDGQRRPDAVRGQPAEARHPAGGLRGHRRRPASGDRPPAASVDPHDSCVRQRLGHRGAGSGGIPRRRSHAAAALVRPVHAGPGRRALGGKGVRREPLLASRSHRLAVAWRHRPPGSPVLRASGPWTPGVTGRLAGDETPAGPSGHRPQVRPRPGPPARRHDLPEVGNVARLPRRRGPGGAARRPLRGGGAGTQPPGRAGAPGPHRRARRPRAPAGASPAPGGRSLVSASMRVAASRWSSAEFFRSTFDIRATR